MCSVTQLCLTLCDPLDCSPPGSSVHGIFPGNNTGVGCHFLLQEIFLTQGLNPSLCVSCIGRQIHYHCATWEALCLIQRFDGKESACNAGDLGSIPGSGRSPGKGNGNPLQYSCLENSIDRGAWWATVYDVTKSRT